MATWGTAKGFNFRSTTAYVTDGTNEQAVPAATEVDSTSAVPYPTTNTIGGDSVTYGWVVAGAGVDTRNRNSGLDRRFAGMNYNGTDGTEDFKIDLPATGSYTIRLASGDPSNAQPTKVELFDNASSLAVLCSTATSGADRFRDAVDAEYSSANWPASNTSVTKTFATTTCIFRIGTGSAATGFLSHIQITQNAVTSVAAVVGGLLGQ